MKILIDNLKELANLPVGFPKNEAYTILEALDARMLAVLDMLKYDPNKDGGVSLFRETTDVRLISAQKLYNDIKEYPMIGLQHIVTLVSNKLSDIIKSDLLMFAHDVELKGGSGIIRAEISTATFGHTFSDDNVFATACIEKRMAEMSALGYEIVKDEKFRGYMLPPTEKNIRLIEEYLGQFAKISKLNTGYHKGRKYIDRIEIFFSPEDLFKMSSAIKEEPELSTSLTENDLYKIKKYTEQIASSLYAKDIAGVQTVCYVAEGYFSELCDMFGTKFSISERKENRHAEERKKNIKINELEKEIGQLCFEANNFREISQAFSDAVEAKLSVCGFSYPDIVIGPYCINVEVSSSDHCSTDEPLTKVVSSKFVEIDGERYIKSVAAGKWLVEKCIPSAEVLDMKVQNVGGSLVVRSIKFSLREIRDMIPAE